MFGRKREGGPMTEAERKRKQRKLDSERPKTPSVTIYMFGDIDIMAIPDLEGEIWFKAIDLARALDIEDPRSAVSLYVDPDCVKTFEEMSISNQYRFIPGMRPNTTFVNEEGMNSFVLQSRMPKARPFQKWVCETVLKSIRREGKFEVCSSDNNPYEELNRVYKQMIDDQKVEMEQYKRKLAEIDNIIKAKDDVNRKLLDQLFLSKPISIIPETNPLKKEVFVLLDKKDPTKEYPFFALRIQRDSYDERVRAVKRAYPNAQILLEHNVPNAVNYFNALCETFASTITRKKKRGEDMNSIKLVNPDAPNAVRYMVQTINNFYRATYAVVDYSGNEYGSGPSC